MSPGQMQLGCHLWYGQTMVQSGSLFIIPNNEPTHIHYKRQGARAHIWFDSKCHKGCLHFHNSVSTSICALEPTATTTEPPSPYIGVRTCASSKRMRTFALARCAACMSLCASTRIVLWHNIHTHTHTQPLTIRVSSDVPLISFPPESARAPFSLSPKSIHKTRACARVVPLGGWECVGEERYTWYANTLRLHRTRVNIMQSSLRSPSEMRATISHRHHECEAHQHQSAPGERTHSHSSSHIALCGAKLGGCGSERARVGWHACSTTLILAQVRIVIMSNTRTQRATPHAASSNRDMAGAVPNAGNTGFALALRK